MISYTGAQFPGEVIRVHQQRLDRIYNAEPPRAP